MILLYSFKIVGRTAFPQFLIIQNPTTPCYFRLPINQSIQKEALMPLTYTLLLSKITSNTVIFILTHLINTIVRFLYIILIIFLIKIDKGYVTIF